MKIDRADFWELRARIRDVDALEHELLKQRLEGTKRLTEAQQKVNAAITALATKYHLPADGAWRMDDETCEVTPQPAGSGPIAT